MELTIERAWQGGPLREGEYTDGRLEPSTGRRYVCDQCEDPAPGGVRLKGGRWACDRCIADPERAPRSPEERQIESERRRNLGLRLAAGRQTGLAG